jgi:hypothetical protein
MLFCMTYITGTKQKIVNTHEETANCSKYGCSIHNPSNHNMKDWPTHWRDDRGMMERICEHGVGHPDPDHINWVSRNVGPRAASVVSIHGCDGCCRKENNND